MHAGGHPAPLYRNDRSRGRGR